MDEVYEKLFENCRIDCNEHLKNFFYYSEKLKEGWLFFRTLLYGSHITRMEPSQKLSIDIDKTLRSSNFLTFHHKREDIELILSSFEELNEGSNLAYIRKIIERFEPRVLGLGYHTYNKKYIFQKNNISIYLIESRKMVGLKGIILQ